jgi:8-oxo-dGTP diphosphatase
MTTSTIRVVAAVIEREGRYLITQRRPTAVLPLLWEFPGGRVENGETDQQALIREVDFRLGVRVKPGQLIGFVSHPYERYVVDLYSYACELEADEPLAYAALVRSAAEGGPDVKRNVHDFRWVRSAEFDQYAFTPADERSVSKLLGLP